MALAYFWGMNLRLWMILLVWLDLGGLVQAQVPRDSAVTYRRYETVDAASYRTRVTFVDPLTALPAPPSATPRLDTLPRRVRTTVLVAPALRSLIQRYVEHHASLTVIEGFRIQVFSGTNREAAARARAEAQQYLPTREVVAFFDRPYFKVRVGDFYSRAEADRALREVRIWFSGAFVVPDQVRAPH